MSSPCFKYIYHASDEILGVLLDRTRSHDAVKITIFGVEIRIVCVILVQDWRLEIRDGRRLCRCYGFFVRIFFLYKHLAILWNEIISFNFRWLLPKCIISDEAAFLLWFWSFHIRIVAMALSRYCCDVTQENERPSWRYVFPPYVPSDLQIPSYLWAFCCLKTLIERSSTW